MNRPSDGRHPVSRRRALGWLGAPLLLGACAVRTAPPQAEPTEPAALPPDQIGPYPPFTSRPEIAGLVRCEGSSAVGLVLNALAGDFREVQPAIELDIVSSGSGTAARALAEGRCDLATMSRAMTAEEIALVERGCGCPVRSIDIALDAVAVCVNVDHPLERMTLRDLDRIFGRERRRGGGPATAWSDLGVTGELGTLPIVAVGMGEDSGSNGLVREAILLGGSFRTTVIEEPVYSSVVQAIAADPAAIGYCSAFFATERTARNAKIRPSRVRALSLETLDGSGFAPPDDASVRSGRYPLARALRICFVDDPARPNPAARQLLRFLVSEDGQEILGQLGQRTLSPGQAQEMFRRVG